MNENIKQHYNENSSAYQKSDSGKIKSKKLKSKIRFIRISTLVISLATLMTTVSSIIEKSKSSSKNESVKSNQVNDSQINNFPNGQEYYKIDNDIYKVEINPSVEKTTLEKYCNMFEIDKSSMESILDKKNINKEDSLLVFQTIANIMGTSVYENIKVQDSYIATKDSINVELQLKKACEDLLPNMSETTRKTIFQILVSISMHETSNYSSKEFLEKNNFGGIKSRYTDEKTTFKDFHNMERGAYALVYNVCHNSNFINNNTIQEEINKEIVDSNIIIEEIGNFWCPTSGDINSFETEINGNWIPSVKNIYNDIINEKRFLQMKDNNSNIYRKDEEKIILLSVINYENYVEKYRKKDYVKK
ncbi:MAG: hypothetical protein ACK5HL_00175 [Bacilli bacterium]